MHQIDPVLHHSPLSKLVMLMALIGLTGCMAIPYPHHRVLEGSEITAESLKSLHVGETTRTQVLNKLGPPDIDFVDQRVIAYEWSGIADEMLVYVFLGPGDSLMLSRIRRALFVRFDSSDKVAAFSIIERPKELIPYDALDQSRDAHVDDWRVTLDQWSASQASEKNNQKR
jgi:hypothetical protein